MLLATRVASSRARTAAGRLSFSSIWASARLTKAPRIGHRPGWGQNADNGEGVVHEVRGSVRGPDRQVDDVADRLAEFGGDGRPEHNLSGGIDAQVTAFRQPRVYGLVGRLSGIACCDVI